MFEGEGHVSWNVGWRMSVSMTDEDIVRRWADVTGARVRGPYVTRRPTGAPGKPIMTAHIGRDPHVRAVMEKFVPWLGERRVAQYETALARRAERFSVRRE